jgi:hypothetical protein
MWRTRRPRDAPRFIDANVDLTFVIFEEEDLEELRKLLVAIRNADLKLWTTPQVSDKLRRNQEAKVADSLNSLRKLEPVRARGRAPSETRASRRAENGGRE